jgi:hypothetical protein
MNDYHQAGTIVGHNVYILRSVVADLLDGWLYDAHQHRFIAAEQAALAAVLHDLGSILTSAIAADTSREIAQ